MKLGVTMAAIVGNPIYIEWACYSLATAKKHMPKVLTSLYTNRPDLVKKCKWGTSVDDILRAPAYPPIDWQGAMIDGILESERLGYDATLFTGADTVFCDDATPTMKVLASGTHDLALSVARDQRKRRYPLRGVPAGFPYYKDGCLIFAWNDAVRKFMKDWKKAFDTHKVECVSSKKKKSPMHPTMPPLQEALYQNNNLRLLFLTDNYNTQFWCGAIYGKAVIVHVHGAGGKRTQKFADRLNKDWKSPRVFKDRKIV